MFLNSSKILFFMTMMMGTLITMTANSWLSAWMGLEINLLSFIPLMSDNNNLMSTESSLKYFLIQALASTVLLFSIILMKMKFNYNFTIKLDYLFMILMSSLLMKMGAAPFHFWFPNLIEGLSWMNSLILMTWQKIAPMILMMNFFWMNFFIFSIIISSIIGALGGFNQTSLKKLMAFSSFNHLSWMLSSVMISEMLWMIYFLIYTFLSMILIFLFNWFKLFHLSQLFSINLFKNLKFTLLLNLFSLGGLPPFLGFLPKWLTIQYLTFNNQFLLLIILMMMTLVTLFFYLRICYSGFKLTYHENKWNMNIKFNKLYFFLYLLFTFFSIFSFPLISLMFII